MASYFLELVLGVSLSTLGTTHHSLARRHDFQIRTARNLCAARRRKLTIAQIPVKVVKLRNRLDSLAASPIFWRMWLRVGLDPRLGIGGGPPSVSFFWQFAQKPAIIRICSTLRGNYRAVTVLTLNT